MYVLTTNTESSTSSFKYYNLQIREMAFPNIEILRTYSCKYNRKWKKKRIEEKWNSPYRRINFLDG